MKKVLIVDDEFLIRFTLEEGLKDRGYETQSAETVKDALEKMKTFHPQVILLDNRLQDSLGIDEISTFRSADEEVQVILMTAYGSVAQAVEATKRGAYDYILKPFDIDEIDRIASRCIGQMQDRESLEFLKGKTQEFIGVSDAAMRIRRHIELLGKNSTVNVLIRGETGTGKEVAASLIHACSDRRDHLMVRINCSAIPEHLMESELFGYERGAFAGAMKTKKGLIELAAGGTVFLDEIGELPLSMQTKILTFLDHKKFKRVGGLEDIEVDARVIAATNRNLEHAVGCGHQRRFRMDGACLVQPCVFAGPTLVVTDGGFPKENVLVAGAACVGGNAGFFQIAVKQVPFEKQAGPSVRQESVRLACRLGKRLQYRDFQSETYRQRL